VKRLRVGKNLLIEYIHKLRAKSASYNQRTIEKNGIEEKLYRVLVKVTSVTTTQAGMGLLIRSIVAWSCSQYSTLHGIMAQMSTLKFSQADIVCNPVQYCQSVRFPYQSTGSDGFTTTTTKSLRTINIYDGDS